jgi:hypothetical protein
MDETEQRRRNRMADWKAVAERSQKKIASFYAENKATLRAAADTAEVWTGAGVMAFVHGRYGGIPKRFGIPLDMAATVLLKAFAFGGWFGTKAVASDLHSLGNGTGAWWIGTMLLDVGQNQLKKAKKADGTAEALGRPLTEDEAKARNLDIRTNTIIAGERAARQMSEGAVRGMHIPPREQAVSRAFTY